MQKAEEETPRELQCLNLFHANVEENKLHIISANTNLEFRLHEWTLEGGSLKPDFLTFIHLIVDMIDSNCTLIICFLSLSRKHVKRHS